MGNLIAVKDNLAFKHVVYSQGLFGRFVFSRSNLCVCVCREGENLGHGEQGAYPQERVPAHLGAHQGSRLVLG